MNYLDDLSELPKYKFQMRGSSAGTKSSASASKSHSPSMLERRTSGRHIVEFAAAQTRQQELAQNEAKAQVSVCICVCLSVCVFVRLCVCVCVSKV